MSDFYDAASPMVTVVIPTCNRLDMLPLALQSVARQTYPHFECVVVNDHLPSQGEVTSAVNVLADKRFSVLHNFQSSGAAVTRNNGIRQARGTILAFLDDDDTWMPEYLEEHVRVHLANTGVGLVYSGILLRWQDQVLPEKILQAKPPPRQEEAPLQMMQGKFKIFTTSALSIKKKCLDKVGLFDEQLPSFEDWDLCYQISKCFPLACIEKPLTVFSQHLKYRKTGHVDERKNGLESLRQKYSSEEGLPAFYRKYSAQIHFTSIKNNVLTGKNEWNRQVLKDYLSQNIHFQSSRYEIKVTLKMIILVLFGKPGFKIINLF